MSVTGDGNDKHVKRRAAPKKKAAPKRKVAPKRKTGKK